VIRVDVLPDGLVRPGVVHEQAVVFLVGDGVAVIAQVVDIVGVVRDREPLESLAGGPVDDVRPHVRTVGAVRAEEEHYAIVDRFDIEVPLVGLVRPDDVPRLGVYCLGRRLLALESHGPLRRDEQHVVAVTEIGSTCRPSSSTDRPGDEREHCHGEETEYSCPNERVPAHSTRENRPDVNSYEFTTVVGPGTVGSWNAVGWSAAVSSAVPNDSTAGTYSSRSETTHRRSSSPSWG